MESLYVIKIGGNIIDDPSLLTSFLQKFAGIKSKKILVHGGGKLATRVADQMGIPQTMSEGRRITDAETLKIVTMVYAGYINKHVVAELQSVHCNAAGFTGADGNSILSHKREKAGIDFGFAGDIDRVNADWIRQLIDNNITPVFAPITHNGMNQLLNTNADTIAQELAKALTPFYKVSLVYSFEKAGVLTDVENETSVIRVLRFGEYKEMKNSKKIFAGMIPKLDNAFTALSKGVYQVIIGQGQNLDLLISGKSGTTILYE